MNNFYIENKRRRHLPPYFERGRFSLYFALVCISGVNCTHEEQIKFQF